MDPTRTQRVNDRVDDRGGAGDRAGLADALDAQRMGGRRRLGSIGRDRWQVRSAGQQVLRERTRDEVPALVVDRVLVEGLGDALHHAAVHLAFDDQRVDHLPDVVHGHVTADRDPSRLRVHLGGAQVRAVRERERGGIEGRLGVEVRLDAVRQVMCREDRDRDLGD
jgi:hypothetical protein